MSSECVKVMVRCRPMNTMEKQKGCLRVVNVDSKLNQIDLQKPGEIDAAKVFQYDFTFGPEQSQEVIYEETAFSLVESVVEGYNGTIFAYGQTGCGKTHTMLGIPTHPKEKGIIPRTFSHIMNIVNSSTKKQFLVRCSYLEIYNEEIHDLLGKDCKYRMELKESPERGVFIKDLTQNIVRSVEEMEQWMNEGTKNRSVGETLMNKDSSRSHSIFTLYVECSITDDLGAERFTAGKLNLVDLAGSERQAKTQTTGDRLKEATKINLSLSALGNVISALVDGKSTHIPYRDSKLTRMLQDSLGGNTKTIMIAACSPADYNYEETLSTLRYASRAKNIKNQPKVNEDPKDAMLREYADEIKKLKELLLKQQSGDISLQEFQNQMKSNQTISKNDPGFQDQIKILQEQMQQQVLDKEQAFEQERQEKLKLENVIKEMEQKLMKGGTGDEQEKKKYAQLKNKLKQKEEEHQKLVEDKQKADEEVLFLGNKYSNLQEEVTEMRGILNKIRKKYKQALNEIKDLEKEHETQREEYLDMIRQQEQENSFNKAVVQILLKPSEIDLIKQDSEYNEGNFKKLNLRGKKIQYSLILLQRKKVKVPQNLGGPRYQININNQAQEKVDAEKENREMIIEKEKVVPKFKYTTEGDDQRQTVPPDISTKQVQKKIHSNHENKVMKNIILDPIEGGVVPYYDNEDDSENPIFMDKNKIGKSAQKLQPLSYQDHKPQNPNQQSQDNSFKKNSKNQKLESIQKEENGKTIFNDNQNQIKSNKLQLNPIN